MEAKHDESGENVLEAVIFYEEVPPYEVGSGHDEEDCDEAASDGEEESLGALEGRCVRLELVDPISQQQIRRRLRVDQSVAAVHGCGSGVVGHHCRQR